MPTPMPCSVNLLDCRRSYLMTRPEHELDAAQQATLAGWLARRLNGEPIAHLIGEREFWSLPLKVARPPDPAPRYRGAGGTGAGPPAGRPCALLDLGTGAGAIALRSSLSDRMPMYGRWTDAGRGRIGPHQQRRPRVAIEVRDGGWFAPLSDAPRFAMIVSRPISTGRTPIFTGDVRFEAALRPGGGGAGLADIRLIVTQAPAIWCQVAGCCWNGWDQGEAVRQLLLQQGYVGETVRDYGD